VILIVGVLVFKEDEGQVEFNKMRKKIISRLPQSATDFDNEITLRHKILHSVVKEKIKMGYTEERSLRRYALRTIFESMGYTKYKDDSPVDPEYECAWKGIKCGNQNGTTIIKWTLTDLELYGTLASEIALLPLAKLFLDKNSIFETIPSEIGLLNQLTHLKLNNNNLLSGPIPSEIGLLNQLTHLELNNNNLSGPIPSEIGQLKSIRDLFFHENSFNGTIPPEIFRLDQAGNKLRINFGQNVLSGTIPSEIGLLGSKVKSIDFTWNQLTGSIPSEIGILSHIQFLLFNTNELSGSIPSEIGLFKKIEHIMLEGNDLNGTLPSEISLLNQTLQDLNVNLNNLSGSIPSEIGLLSKLTSLKLKNNKFSGNIPSEIGQLPEMCYLYLQRNPNLSGEISNVTCSNIVDSCSKGRAQIKHDKTVKCECDSCTVVVD